MPNISNPQLSGISHGSAKDYMKGMRTEKERNSYRSGTEFNLQYIFNRGGQRVAGRGLVTDSEFDIDANFEMLKAFIDANKDKITEINLDEPKLEARIKKYAQEKGISHLLIQSLAERRGNRSHRQDGFIVVRYAE